MLLCIFLTYIEFGHEFQISFMKNKISIMDFYETVTIPMQGLI